MDSRSNEKRMLWLEEYKTCSCSFLARTKLELPGYCQKHGNDKRRQMRVPDKGETEKDMGYAG